MPLDKQITILGAGLSGLSTAFHLARSLPSSSSSKTKTKITLIDAAPRVGGWIDSTSHNVSLTSADGAKREGSLVLESGPRTIRPRGSRGAAGMLKMLRDLDLLDSIIPISTSHPAAKNRFLLDTTTSTLTALPSSPLSLVRRQPPLLRGLVPSILSEPFRPRRAPSPPPSPPSTTKGDADEHLGSDESVDSFFSRRFSPAIAQNLASAMVHGIYATSSSSLSVRAAFPSLWDSEDQYGSVVLGMLRGTKSAAEKAEEAAEWDELGELGKERAKWALYGLKGGLGSITTRLEERIRALGVDLRLGESVQKVDIDTDGSLSIQTSQKTTKADHLISALSPSKLAPLLASPLPGLDFNPSTSVGVVNLVYPLPFSQIHPEGFGYLIPRSETAKNPGGILGVIFDSTALPTSPVEVQGQVTKLTVMLGGPYWSTYTPALPIPPAHDLVRIAKRHLHTVFPVLKDVEPVLERAKIHKDCIPTYLPGHGDRLREIHRILSSEQGGYWKGKLSLVGNGYGGVGVNDCVLSAVEVAKGLGQGRSVTGLERWSDWI